MLQNKENVTNNVANEELQQLYNAGELPDGYYYFKDRYGKIHITSEYGLYCQDYKIQVLAPIPTYEEYQALKEKLDIAVKALLIITNTNKEYYSRSTYKWLLDKTNDIAQEALTKIKGDK